MKQLEKMVGFMESITEWMGKAASWLIFVLIISLTYEVISRHIFNAPTFWSFDISYMLGGTAMVLGAAYTLKEKKHVRVDLIYSTFSPRVKAIVDVVLSLVLLFPLFILGFMNSYQAAALSWVRAERIMSGYWQPPIYPLKTVVPIALALLIMQGLAELIRNIAKLRGREL